MSPGSIDTETLGRNTFRASGLSDIDLALSRRFPLRDSAALSVRVEALNVANHPNFGIPVRYVEAPGFGTAVNTITPPRTFQLVLRLTL